MDRKPMDSLTGAAGTTSSHASSLTNGPQSCRWGQPTLFLDYPVWLYAWDSPWTCGHPAHPGPLETAETCASCRHWTPSGGHDPESNPH
jgi:hypothetical protein